MMIIDGQEEAQLKGLTKRLEEFGCCLQPAQSYRSDNFQSSLLFRSFEWMFVASLSNLFLQLENIPQNRVR